jgi:hypothetical protein
MSLSLYNSTIVPLLDGQIFLGAEYDNIIDFAEINISINCNTGYILTYLFSQDKLTFDFSETQTITVSSETQFFIVPVRERYFKLKIEANDGDMGVLNVQTIYKSNITYQDSGAPASNVAISSPLNLDGSVFVGGNLSLTGSVDANITNASLDVNVLNTVDSVDANITNALLNVSDVDTHTKLDDVITDLNKLTYDVNSNLNINLNDLNSNFIDTNNNDGFKVAVQNSSIAVSGSISVSNFPATQAVSNGSLSSMSFDTNRLNVFDTDANTKLTNIYNIVNSRGQAQMMNGFTITAIELPNVKSCTIYGNVASATILTLKFSPNGTDFYNSQYSVNMSGAGDFGFVIDGLCPKWIMFNNSNSVNAVAFIDYC